LPDCHHCPECAGADHKASQAVGRFGIAHDDELLPPLGRAQHVFGTWTVLEDAARDWLKRRKRKKVDGAGDASTRLSLL
jgi:hypothetical protein